MTRKVLIYGGSGGISSAVARMLHDRGCELHLVGRNEARLAAIATELGATATVGDVNDANFFDRTMQDIGGHLDGLVYAVGTINLASLARLSEADFLNDFRINALGAALAVQAALPALKKCKETASVVLFSSVAARQGFTFHASISMAKGAIDGLTLALAAELAPKIRVNAIAPSLTRTSLAEKLLSSDRAVEAIAAMHPLGRLGTPEDIASLCTFLLSDEASWISGQIIGVDGGRSMLRTKG
jgi:NAD(P)-dependent dehydrogenase (short-subunit alcohol dehydrogenase family)